VAQAQVQAQIRATLAGTAPTVGRMTWVVKSVLPKKPTITLRAVRVRQACAG
jgi:hypothetical protein